MRICSVIVVMDYHLEDDGKVVPPGTIGDDLFLRVDTRRLCLWVGPAPEPVSDLAAFFPSLSNELESHIGQETLEVFWGEVARVGDAGQRQY